MIRGPRTIAGEVGFIVSGRDADGKKVSLWAPSRKSAEHIRDKLKAGEKIVAKDYFEESAQRDYKKEYAKFQSSPQKKKYRAELNKYNRSKGTYGNGDGKDASHKSGKISGYEAEGKNRGRREKSRLKGSKRKTEGVVMPTLREFIIREATAEIVERLSKRWNIVDSVGPSWDGAGGEGGSGVSAESIKQAVQDGDLATILQAIKRVVSLRRKGSSDSTSDNTLKNLLKIFIHVKKNTASMNEGVVNELTKAQDRLIQKLRKGGSGWQNLLGTDEERAAAGLSKGLPAMDGPRVEYNYAMGQARLTEMGVTITEKGDASWGGPDVKAGKLQAKELEPEDVPENFTEGFTGYESYGQSDTASDHFSNLEDIQRKNRDDPKGYKADVEGWMKKIAQDKGNEYNLNGFEALGLISKDLLFQRIITASGVNIKPLARKAIQSISKDLKRLTSGKPAWHEEDQIKGYHAMIRALKRFV